MKTVMIVAGESSGELYGALLAKALRSLWPDIRLMGIGGEKMREAGVEILSGVSGALGLTEAAATIRRVRESFRKASKALTDFSPDVVVLIDYPDFNFRLAKIAKRHGLKVLYYVSPQVWAWRKGRVKTMARIADRLAVILPFEERIYERAGLPCEFVGHPVMEEIEQCESGRRKAEGGSENEKSEISDQQSPIKNPVISLLPGSRESELKALLPVFIEVVGTLKEDIPGAGFLLPLAPNIEGERFKDYFAALEGKGVTLLRGGALGALASSDLAVVASGTATLQSALVGTPMVVVYKVSPLTYLAGRAILDVKHISLVNIIAGEEVVPELIQHKATAKNIVDLSKRVLSDGGYRADMISSLGKIREAFAGKKPSLRVAELIGELAGWSHAL